MNIDIKRVSLVTLTAFVGTVIGSYCGYLFSQQSPDGLGYISMLTTVFLGVKFLFKPITGGQDASASVKQSARKTVLACCWAAVSDGSAALPAAAAVF